MAGLNLLKLAIAIAIIFHFTAVKSEDDVEKCLLNRLEFISCRFHHRTPRPGPNQFGIYETRLNTNANPKSCRVRRTFQDESSQVRSITDLDGVLVINSPGFNADPQELYSNNLLGEYNLQCKEGDTLFLELTSLELEPANCFNALSDSNLCQDYLQLDLSNSIVDELCGSATNDDNTYLLPENKLRVWFRTSEEGMFAGFRGYAICFPPSNSQDVNRRSSCTEATLGVGSAPSLPDSPQLILSPISVQPPPLFSNQRPPLFPRLVEEEDPTATEEATPSSNFYVPSELTEVRTRISSSSRALLRAPFTTIQRTVKDTLVEGLYFMDSILRKNGAMSTTDRTALDAFLSAVKVAQVNIDSCNPIVAALSRSLVSVETRVNRSEFQETTGATSLPSAPVF